ncbi:M20 family metallopeptidase [uncultured Bilophila sp.]|uniref:M20 family metallopeptidase n=1 Tax=uncultured Bilophila sp. TaxID=529385 RepID=UPI00280A8128|nr:M20 family metallopeptidase [uncultured Bilophila sp.]
MSLMEWKRALDAQLENQEYEMLILLEQLVSIDSPTADAAGVNRVGETLTGWLAQEGFAISRLPKPAIPEDEPWQADLGDVFMARSHAHSTGPGIAFIGHMDTVFPVGTARSRPFRLDRAADRATGPGVADMKAGLVANLFAARALKRLGVPFPMTLMFSPDEELGSPTASKALAAQLPGALAVICAEPGGVGEVVTVSRKGSGHMHLKITGKAAHAGRCYADGASAVLELAHKTLAINGFLDLSRSLTVNTGLISGGTSANSVAPWAESRIHLTYRTLEDGKRVVAGIRDTVSRPTVPGTTAAISGGLRLYPLERTPQGDKLFGLVREAGGLLGMRITGQHYESAAESGFCSSQLGIPTICCMGPEGDNIHSVDEFMIPSTLLPRCKLIALAAIQAAEAFG